MAILLAGATLTSAGTTTCGTGGGGTQRAVNLRRYTCTNCGFRPCIAAGNICYSCYGVDKRCYAYDCGTHCSSTPCKQDYSTCGTKGGGDAAAANNPSYTCYNCGPSPCVSGAGVCYSCYSPATKSCYKYHCGSTCSATPCRLGAGQVSAANSSGGGGVPPHWVPKMQAGAPASSPPAVAELQGSAPADPSSPALAAMAAPGSSAPSLRADGAWEAV